MKSPTVTAIMDGKPITAPLHELRRLSRLSLQTLRYRIRRKIDLAKPVLIEHAGILSDGSVVMGTLPSLRKKYGLSPDQLRQRLQNGTPLDRPVGEKIWTGKLMDGSTVSGKLAELAKIQGISTTCCCNRLRAGVPLDMPLHGRRRRRRKRKPQLTWPEIIKPLQTWCHAPIDPYVGRCAASINYRRAQDALEGICTRN